MFAIPRYRRFAAALVILCGIDRGWMPTAHGEDRVIRFGGVRNVVVIISDSADRYRIVVNMLAVKAFDPATNKRLNLQKARAIAIKALAKHAAMKNGAPFTVRGMEVQDMTTANGSYRLVLLLPKENIAAIAVERPKPPSPEKGGFNENRAPPAAAQRAGKTERPSGQKRRDCTSMKTPRLRPCLPERPITLTRSPN